MSKQERMFALVDEYSQSGLSANVFCEQNNIAVPKFNYWARKKRQNHNGSGFIKVATDKKFKQVPVELIYPNGVRLQLATADPVVIAGLLKIY